MSERDWQLFLKDIHEKMAGLRDIVVHDYFGIDVDIIWDVVTVRIPELKRQISSMISETA